VTNWHSIIARIAAASRRCALLVLLVVGLSACPWLAFAADRDVDDDDEEDEAPGVIVSIDLNSAYALTPGYGFLVSLPLISDIALTSPTTRGLTLDVPLKIQFNDRFSIYLAALGSSQKLGSSSWSSFQFEAWRAGFSADIFVQSGAMPTVTLSGSVSQPFERAVQFFKTTTWTAGLDLDYAFGAEEKFGLVAGVNHAVVKVDFGPVTIRPTSIFYVGGYRRFDDWKMTGQLGVQHFDGAQLSGLINVRPVTTPFVRLELERVDEDYNRLLAVSAAVGWSPKLTMLMTLNVPIYLYGR
jgi:hypothetical protein